MTIAGCCMGSKELSRSIAEGLVPYGSLNAFTVVFATNTHNPPPRFALFVPPMAHQSEVEAARTALPCIVFLHGRGECGTDGLKQCVVGLLPAAMLNSRTAAEGGWGDFVIVAPQKPEFDDTWAQHEDLVLASLEQAKGFVSMTGCTIDPTRIYLTGLSQGGAGTWAIGAKHPEIFAAIAPVCGFVPGETKDVKFGDDPQRSAIAAPLAKAQMPVWAFHGLKDDVVPPDQTRLLVGALDEYGWRDDVRASYYPDANHNSWDHAYREDGPALARWFLAHSKAPKH
jgi:predicted peptidase